MTNTQTASRQFAGSFQPAHPHFRTQLSFSPPLILNSLNMATPMSRVMETLEDRVQTFKCHLYVDGPPEADGKLVAKASTAATLGLVDESKVYAVFTSIAASNSSP